MKNKLFVFCLFFCFLNLYAQENGQPAAKYHIIFEGRFKNEAVKIIADDSLVYEGIITSKNPDVIAMAGIVTLDILPRKLKIIINHKKISFISNPENPYLYIEKKRFRKYAVMDSSVKRKYR